MMDVKLSNLGPGLDVAIYSHELTIGESSLPAWSLVTEGLASFGQREVTLTILRRGGAEAEFPDGVLRYVGALKLLGDQGKTVKIHDVSGYRAPGPFGLGSFVGVAFIEAMPIPGLHAPDGALAGVFLTEGELAMATRCSVLRVLHRLGKVARYYPTPYWSDPSRQTVYDVADVERSVLSQLERAVVPEAAATLQGDAMRLTLPRAFATSLAERIESHSAAAVLPAREPAARGALVWSPGQHQPEAILAEGSDGATLAATFVALVPHDEAGDEIRFMEDGYAALLSAGTTKRLAAALRAEAPFELRGGTHGRMLAISVIPSA